MLTDNQDKRYLVVFPFSFADRTEYIIEKFFKDAVDFSHVIHLTSRQTRINDFRTRLAILTGKSIIPPASFSLKTFASDIVNEKTRYRLISSVEQILILLKLSSASILKNINPVGFAALLRLFIKDFKVSHEKFDFLQWRKQVDEYPWKYQDNKSVIDIALEIMEQYQEFLEKNNLADEDDLYKIATEYLADYRFDTVFIEGMLEFIPSQRAFIKQICDRSKRVILAYQFDKNAYYDANSLILEENLNFLRRLVDNVEYVSVNEDKTHEILYSFPSPDEEVKAIGQMIRDTISKEHCLNWEDFLVVFPDMLSYRVFVQRIFTRLEIPFCMTPGYVLGQDPSMVALVSFMEWIAYPSWEGLMSMFTSPFFSFDAQETKQFSRTSREIFKAIGFFPSQAWSRNWKNWKRIEKARKIMSSKKTQSITNWVDCFKQSMELVGWKSFDNEGAIGLMRIFNDLADDTSVDLSMFKNIFKSALNLTEVEKSRGKGVRVMGVLDSMGVEAKIVFFGGATDDNLPMSAKREEFFLPDALKRDLNLADYELKIARERLDLYRLKKTGKKIVFTYPVRMNGRQKNRSIMLHGLSENPVSAEYVTSSRITIFLSGVSHEKFFERFLKNDILNFTVSQIDDLSKCPYRFYLRYVEHIEPYKSPVIEERPEFWGNLLHTAAEKSAYEFIGKIQDSSIIKAQYDSFYGFVNEFLEKPENMSSQYGYVLPAAVRAFLEKRKPYVFKAFENLLKKHQGHRIIEVEAKHAIRIGNMAITGKFDRVEETEDGLVEIIDYKSGKIPAVNKKYPESRNCLDLTNLELPLYGLIKYKNDGICPGIVVWAFNFEETHDEKYYNQITEDFLKIFEEDLIKLGSDLKNQNFQFSPKNNCYSCPFNQFCMMKEGISDD